MEDAVLQIIKKKLHQIGEDYNSQKQFIKDWLNKVEEYIEENESSYASGVALIKGSKYSVKSVADKLGCSRTTLYNYDQLLKRYIELSISLSGYDYCMQAKALKDEVSRLKNIIKKMEIRDVELERQKYENKQLMEKLKAANADNEKLISRIAKISNENRGFKEREN